MQPFRRAPGPSGPSDPSGLFGLSGDYATAAEALSRKVLQPLGSNRVAAFSLAGLRAFS